MRRFATLAVFFAFSLAGCAGKGTAPLPQVPLGMQARGGGRGSIVWIRRVTTFKAAQLSGAHTSGLLGTAEQVITQLGGAPACNVTLYAIEYNTIGVMGEPATASAGFFVPQHGCKGPYTLVGYGQGTNVVKAQKITKPTKINIEPAVLAAIFAAHGYATVATDYLGMGYSNYSFQPYLVVSSEASAVIDAMRAARAAAARLGVALSGKVFLTGHSQGGQTALGTQKTIEAQNAAEFNLIADAPSSGPYALTRTDLDGLRRQGQGAAIFSTYMLTAYNKTYGNVYAQPSDVFQNPYAGYVNDLLPVRTYAQAAALSGKTLPLKLTRLLQPSFLASFRHDRTSGARADLRLNDLLDGWKPRAPLYLCGGSKDPEVEFQNSELAYRYFRREGAKVQLLDVNPYMPSSVTPSEYHDAVLILCHTLERVKVLDALRGPAHSGRWPASLNGPIGPLTYPQPPIP
jgi:pimeloyl-ACP methyl ester carboxylesterase